MGEDKMREALAKEASSHERNNESSEEDLDLYPGSSLDIPPFSVEPETSSQTGSDKFTMAAIVNRMADSSAHGSMKIRKEKRRINPEKRRRQTKTKQITTHQNPLVTSLTRLHAQGDVFVSKIEEQLERRQDLKAAFFKAKSDEKILRQELQQIRDGGCAMARLQTRVRQLEQRIYAASKRRCDLRGIYTELKNNINYGRNEVKCLDTKINDLDKEIQQRKDKVTNIVAASRAAFDRRTNAVCEIKRLEKLHHDAANEFEREWDALSRVMNEKEDRYMMEFSRLRMSTPNQAKDVEATILKKVQRDEEKLKKAVVTGNWASARTRIASHVYNEKVNTFEEAFGKVQRLTGAKSLEHLAEIMAASEDKNYRAFQHLASMNVEVSSLEAAVATLHGQLDESKNQSGAYSAFKRRVLSDLRDKADQAAIEAEDLELSSSELSQKLDIFKPFVRDIFKLAECDSLPIPDTFDLDKLSDREMLQCLGMIEQRVDEILHVFTCVASIAREKVKTLDSYQTFFSVLDDNLTSTARGTECSSNEQGSTGANQRKDSLGSESTPSAVKGNYGVKSSGGYVGLNSQIIVPSTAGPTKPKTNQMITIVPPNVDEFDVQEFDPNDPFREHVDVHRPWHRDDPNQNEANVIYTTKAASPLSGFGAYRS